MVLLLQAFLQELYKKFDTTTKQTIELTKQINKHMFSLLSVHLVRQTQCSLDF